MVSNVSKALWRRANLNFKLYPRCVRRIQFSEMALWPRALFLALAYSVIARANSRSCPNHWISVTCY